MSLPNEDTSLLLGTPKRPSADKNKQHETSNRRQPRFVSGGVSVVAVLLLVAMNTMGHSSSNATGPSATQLASTMTAKLGMAMDTISEDTINASQAFTWTPPAIKKRCDWVVERFLERDAGDSPEELYEKHNAQATDFNVFYRATANLFWHDFVTDEWGNGLLLSLKQHATLSGGIPLTRMSTYTWVTGDQHLSNFGAWRNRHKDIVFGVNDFDEAAIYDFQVDILRVAVSVFNHGRTNGLNDQEIQKALHKFTDSYVKTAIDYVGNEDALTFELTEHTTKGFLKKFLKKLEKSKSRKKQLKKFTETVATSDNTTTRMFTKGPLGEPDPDSKLMSVSPERHFEIVQAFSATEYGATMTKLGWAVREWSDEYFTVLDVAQRVGTGIGSYGVDRYYILLKGTDDLIEQEDGTAVVLDVKYQPNGAFWNVLSEEDQAWYHVMFPNAAARTIEAQRMLTSYTDPYLGWIMLKDDEGVPQPFSVRQRSPWKDSPDLDELDDPKTFSKFMAQVAVATATSHVRGSLSRAAGGFKHVIEALLGHRKDREKWGDAVLRLAAAYHEQVLLDFQCFADFVESEYPN